MSRRLGLSLSFCHMPGRHRHRCVDMKWFARLHPDQDQAPVEYYRRTKCPSLSFCRDSIWDIGWYRPRCGRECVYCYAMPRHAA
jgi:hypothetical protein